MPQTHDSMMNPPVEALLDRVESKFGLVTLAARRARDINSYFNQLGGGLGHMIPPQVSSTARKPLSVAFEEIAADKIEWGEPVEEQPEADLPVGEGFDGDNDAG
ncbi:MAG: DNA-directed RNA polymerase subunit omega [Actinomycetota bacterium]|nr:DNA-directed RNA polymerase subunit omega [Actinomycetota bacterium]MDA3016139.1 DNA-directed RNA polymerase subunit omega [Actinomycetota bacterium]MDA3029344.1 DNA-directed RNA polymerase subunit omega [Actinomycetota bacterium]